MVELPGQRAVYTEVSHNRQGDEYEIAASDRKREGV